MSTDVSPVEPTAAVATDLQDERLIRAEGMNGRLRAARARVRGGDLGSLPVVIGLAVIWVIFQALNSNFLTPGNLSDLAQQCAAVGTISIGVVLVLLLGEIDLSVGSVSGVSAAILGVGFVNRGWPLVPTMLLALAVGALIGTFYSLLFIRFGVPSFVITLAGLLGFQGLQLWILGSTGSINIPFTSWIVRFCQQMFLTAWQTYLAVAVIVVVYVATALGHRRRRVAAGLSATSTTEIAVRGALMLAVLGFAGWYLLRGPGFGWMFALFVALVVTMNFLLTRTRWGRAVYAVGGSVEAARRAGIRVNRIFISVFTATATFAALGGLLAAGRLASANQSTGSADTNLNAIAAAVIGGTSLFGGRGNAYSALLGILVIQSISNGLSLLNLNSPIRYMITGAVLLIAVIIDSLSRRSRRTAGRA